VKRLAELGVIANCTPLWGTDYDGTFHDTYLEKPGAERMEECLYPDGALVRSGARPLPCLTCADVPEAGHLQADLLLRPVT
jgi:hypothetical protein